MPSHFDLIPDVSDGLYDVVEHYSEDLAVPRLC